MKIGAYIARASAHILSKPKLTFEKMPHSPENARNDSYIEFVVPHGLTFFFGLQKLHRIAFKHQSMHGAPTSDYPQYIYKHIISSNIHVFIKIPRNNNLMIVY